MISSANRLLGMDGYSGGTLLKQLMEVLRRVVSTLRTEMDPGVKWQHIAVLWSLHGGGRGTADLARVHRVSAPTMSRTLSKLIQKGWVRKQVSSSDRRRVTFELTDAGWNVLKQTRERAEARLSNMLQNLTEEQLADLQQGLAVLLYAFSGQGCHDKGDSRT